MTEDLLTYLTRLRDTLVAEMKAGLEQDPPAAHAWIAPLARVQAALQAVRESEDGA